MVKIFRENQMSQVISRSMITSIVAALLSMFATGTSFANEVSLTQLVKETKRALLIVAQEWENPQLQLDRVVLEINASATVAGDGSVSFWVVQVGGGVKKSTASTMTLTLAPPDPESGSNISQSTLADTLAAAILAASDAIKEAMKGQPPLIALEYTAEVKFSLTTTAEGGVSVNFPGVEVTADGEIEDASVHSIKAHLKSLK